MKITTTARAWSAAIMPLKLKQNMVMPQQLRIEADATHATITSGSLTTRVQCRIPAHVEATGSAIVPYAQIDTLICAADPSLMLTLSSDDETLTCSAPGLNSTITLIDPDAADVPAYVGVDDATDTIKILARDFATAMNAVQYAALKDFTRPVLKCLQLLATSENTVRVVAADGFRLARTVATVSRCIPGTEILLHQSDIVANALLMARTHPDSTLTIARNATHIEIRGNGYAVAARYTESRYPDIDRVLPKTQPVARAQINSRVLIASLKRMISAHPKEQYCHVSIDAGELTITSPAGTTVSLSSTTEGGANIAINPKFFHSAVYGSDGDVSLSVYEETNKSLVVEREGYYALVALFARR